MVEVTGSDFFSSLFINYSHLHLMCRSPSPLDMSPRSSKAELLGSVRATPGVAGPWTPAEWWVLRAWACLDQGLNFPLKMRKRFMARSHESVSCSLKFLSWWLLLSLGTDYFISSCSFLFLLLHLLLAFHQDRFCMDLLGDLLRTLALSLHSFIFSPFQGTPSLLSTTTTPTLFLLLPLLHPTLFLFSPSPLF